MNNQDYLATLINNAKLHIIECRIDYRSSFEVRNRVLNYYVASYIKEGSCTLCIGDKKYETKAGDVVIIPAHIMHDHFKESNDLTCFMWWHFNYTIGDSIDLLSLYDLPVQFNISNNSRFEEVFSQYLLHASRTDNIIDYIFAEAKGIELIGVLLESAISTSESKLYRCANSVFLEMLCDILDQPVKYSNLDAIADKYHLHPTYISNQFKRNFNISPISLARKICLGKAQQLLAYDSLSINEIASKLGYEVPGNFTRFFKMKVGITPQQFRTAKNRGDQDLAHAAAFDAKH